MTLFYKEVNKAGTTWVNLINLANITNRHILAVTILQLSSLVISRRPILAIDIAIIIIVHITWGWFEY